MWCLAGAIDVQRSAGAMSYAVGIFLCPAAAVKSTQKSRFTPDISNRPRYTN
jgi:hypothetical protein